MKTISNIIESIEVFISIILVAAMTIILFFNVVYRYFLNDPIFWANEASIFMMAWLTFIGGSLGLKYKTQAAITLLVERLSEQRKRMISIITQIIVLIFMVILLYISWDWVLSLTSTVSSSMRIPMWVPYSCVPIGLTFAFIHLLDQFIDLLKGKQGGESV